MFDQSQLSNASRVQAGEAANEVSTAASTTRGTSASPSQSTFQSTSQSTPQRTPQSTSSNTSTIKQPRAARAVGEPAVEVFEDADGITALADMPGVPRDGLDVQLDGDALVIEGEVDVLAPADMRGIWAEVSVPRFRRTFTLGRELDTARIEAGVKDGVLTLRIPKLAHAQPRRIAVSTA